VEGLDLPVAPLPRTPPPAPAEEAA
jgi:hypothetical protein